MRPTAKEVMETIIWTFDQEIGPHVAEGLPKSLANTTSNLLRHVLLRMEFEASMAAKEIAELEELLAKVRLFIATREGFEELIERLDSTDGAEVDDIASLEQLRWRLQDTIEAMHAARPVYGTDNTYQALREEIRDCLDLQLEREALWIDKAFTGPRR